MQTRLETFQMGLEYQGMKLTCGSCNKQSAEIMWDKRYSGFRGFCGICKNNWPES